MIRTINSLTKEYIFFYNNKLIIKYFITSHFLIESQVFPISRCEQRYFNGSLLGSVFPSITAVVDALSNSRTKLRGIVE